MTKKEKIQFIEAHLGEQLECLYNSGGFTSRVRFTPESLTNNGTATKTYVNCSNKIFRQNRSAIWEEASTHTINWLGLIDVSAISYLQTSTELA